MTTKLEQEFFSVFGIEKECATEYSIHCADVENCQQCKELKYPEITAEKLLEMICILNETSCEVLASENIEDLKNEILETCIKVYNTPILTSDGDEYENTAIYDKIQQLFKD
jgi:hypothetical protein